MEAQKNILDIHCHYIILHPLIIPGHRGDECSEAEPRVAVGKNTATVDPPPLITAASRDGTTAISPSGLMSAATESRECRPTDECSQQEEMSAAMQRG